MKTFATTIAAFTFALTALHAQVLPGTTPPALDPIASPAVQAAVQDAINPAVEAAVEKALAALGLQQYIGLVALCGLVFLFLSRVAQARSAGKSWLASFSAATYGTNTPNKFSALIACLALLTLPSCTVLQKIGAILSTPAAKQIEVSLADLGLHILVGNGDLSPGDAITIGDGVAILTSSETGLSKAVKLADIGLATAAKKGLINRGDRVVIKTDTAIITQPAAPTIAPLSPTTPPLTSGK